MTKQEIIALLRLNISLYKLAEKNFTSEDMTANTDIWHIHFQEFDSEIVKKAFIRANAKCRFPIQPLDIFTELHLMAKELRPSSTQLFQELLKTHRKVVRWIGDARDFPNQRIMGTEITYAESRDNKIEKAYNKLDPETKAYLVNWQGLKDLGSFDKEEIETYRRAEFQKHCDNFVNTETTKQILSADFLNSLGGNNLDLLGG